jgi:tRNA splicing ligase
MNEELEELLEQIKAYRNDMVARNYPFQQISDIITKWEMKKVKTISEESQDELEPIKDFLEEAEKEKAEFYVQQLHSFQLKASLEQES